MKKIAIVLCLVFFLIKLNSSNNLQGRVGIIPQPNIVIKNEGKFMLSGKVMLLSDAIVSNEASLLHGYLQKISDVQIIKKVSNFSTKIQLKIDFTFANPESYTLSISKNGITIAGGSSAGVFYGIQSLLQLMPASIYDNDKLRTKVELPCIEIIDSPRFSYRGMHLDVSRHFFSVDAVKRYIDMLAMHKLNVFHWHLTDDNGWRIEIKRYPLLTSVGAWRTEASNQPKYGGFYTQKEVKDVIAYAAKKHISIIPEIEMPGHSMALIAAYPELSCSGLPYKKPDDVAFEFTDPLCAGNEKTFELLENVLAEVIALFPGKYIHVGGDEARKTPWAKCKKCQHRMQVENLQNVEQLQSYFITRMERFISSKGKVMIGWDEILEGGLAPGATVMSWRGEKSGIDAAKMGHDVVMTPYSVTYFDGVQHESRTEGLTQPMLNTLEHVYTYNPVPTALTESETHHILGVQACMWTEYVDNETTLQSRVLPRMSALAEIAWTNLDNKNERDFMQNLELQFHKYYEAGYQAFIIPPVGLQESITFVDNYKVVLSNPYPFGVIRYTLDGSAPNELSPIYKDTIRLTSSTEIKYATFIGHLKSKVLVSKIVKSELKPAIASNKTLSPGISYALYSESISTLNDKPKTISIAQGVLQSVLLPEKRPADFFIVHYEGFVSVSEDDVYIFTISSDDGSRVFVNGERLIDNDGLHGLVTKTGQAALKAGVHSIRVEYFEATQGEQLHFSAVGSKGSVVKLFH